MKIAKLHKFNAYFLAAFICMHLLNHAIGLFGVERHLATQDLFRQIYRIPVIEFTIYALFSAQIFTGIKKVVQRGRPDNRWAWLQVASGLYLAFFLVQHLIAVLVTRYFYTNMDTNAYWAASVVSKVPFSLYFAPYYVLAITALFTHIACVLRFRNWRHPATKLQIALPFVGFGFGLVLVLNFMGIFTSFELPTAYNAYLDSMTFW